MRVLALVVGLPLTVAIVYAAGMTIVPIVHTTDQTILAAINPDSYVPGLDQFIRALTDYTNFLIFTPLASFATAYLLYVIVRKKGRPVFTGLLAIETVALAVMAAMGKIWPNKTYVGANVLLVIAILVAFGAAAYLFQRLDHKAMLQVFVVFWLVFASGYFAGEFATGKIKNAVARPRPLNDANKPWNEKVRIIPDEVLRGKNSFPSGHTSGTFGLLTPLFWYVRNPKGRAAILGWGGLQGFARVYTAAHFPFCVLMGAFLGFSFGTIIYFAFTSKRFRAAPEPVPSV
jgi:membrane-associated phospholipid phosphatase